MTSRPDRPAAAADTDTTGQSTREGLVGETRVRRAAGADEHVLQRLWEEFDAEVPEPAGFQPDTWSEAWEVLQASMIDGAVYLAEAGGEPVGLLHARPASSGRWHLELVQVRPGARRRGVATALVRRLADELHDRGVDYVSLEVLTTNAGAREFWQRLGFDPVELLLAQPADALGRRLGAGANPGR